MVIGQLSLAPGPVDGGGDGAVRQLSSGGGDDVNKTARLPRWTRQEILVLIQGKRVAENRVRRGRGSGSAFGSGQIEPKWASVSSYCKRHGVNRGPVQCRKRWSNLAGDYKKIKEWEVKIKEEADSFWVMRNDLRREKKLPGFFDKEVYDILDGGGGGAAGGGGGDMEEVGSGLDLALASKVEVEEGGEEAEIEVLFDSGRSVAVDDGLFSEFDQSGSVPIKETTPVRDIPAPVPISVATEKQHHQSFPQEELPAEGTGQEKQPEVQEGRKRKRYTMEEEVETNNTTYDFEARLIETLEKNGKLVSSQLEAQNTHLQLDREQRKEDTNSFIAVLNKIADALGKIADKF